MYNLPHPIDQVTGPWFNGLPHQIPFHPPNLPIGGPMAQFVEPTMGMLLAELQANAQANPLRTFLFNQLSQNNYQNEEFANALMTVLEYAELLASGGMSNIEMAVNTAVKEVAAMLTAINVARYPALASTVTDPRAQRNVEELIAKFNQIGNQIDAFNSSRQAQSQPWPGQQSQAAPWDHRPQQASWGAAQQQQWGAPPGRQPMQQSGWQGGYGQQQWHQPQQPRGNPYVGAMAASTPRQQPQGPGFASQGFQGNWSSSNAGTQARSQVMGGSLRPRPATANESVAFDPVQQPGYGAKVEQVDSSDIEWGKATSQVKETTPKESGIEGEIHRKDGSILRPAHSSGWTKTHDPFEPYSVAYDPTTHVLYHRKDRSGKVTEVIMSIDDTEEYLKYETDLGLASKVRFERKADPSRVRWDSVTSIPDMDEVMDERDRRLSKMDLEEGEKALFKEEPLLIMSAITSASLEEARLGASMNLMDVLGEVPEGQPISYLYYHCIPTLNGNKALVEQMEDICLERDFTEAQKKFLAVKELLEPLAWYMLNDKLTEFVNEIVRVELGLQGVSIDSFADDIIALIEDIEKHDGPTYANKLRAQTRRVMRSSCHVLTERMRDQYAQRLEYPVEKPELIEDVVVFGELNSVIEVPWMSGDLSIAVTAEGSAILESSMPQLYKTVQELFNRSDKLKRHAVRSYSILTADNVRFKLHRSLLTEDFYLISRQ